MGRYSSDAERRAFRSFEETCATVDRLTEQLAQCIKDDVTGPFRAALVEAHQEVIDMEAERDAMALDRDTALDRIEALEDEVGELSRERDALAAQLSEAAR
jgi:hypothetical protein